jgi:hypothetical protein
LYKGLRATVLNVWTIKHPSTVDGEERRGRPRVPLPVRFDEVYWETDLTRERMKPVTPYARLRLRVP